MKTRSTGVFLGALALAGACNSTNADKPDAAQPDARSPDARPDAAPAAEPQLPAGTPIAIPLASLNALSYTGQLAFGSQHLTVILDTGSSTLGVAGATCTDCTGVSPLYTPGSGAVDQNATASSSYADSTGWTGEIYEDTVALGDAPAVAVKFGDITTSNGFFRNVGGGDSIGYQGILGLAPDGALIAGTTSYLSTLVSGGTTAEISFQLCHDDGTMWIGGYDAAKQAGPQTVTALENTLPVYIAGVADMGVAGVSLNQDASAFGPTIIDTGTSISFIPAAPLAALTTAIEGSTGYKAAFGTQSLSSGEGCVTSSMTAAQLDAMLPPLDIAFPGVDGGNSPFVDLPATQSYLVAVSAGMWCFGFEDSKAITGGLISASLFGDSLLQAYVTTIDIADQRVGFAPQTGCATASASRTTQFTAPHVHNVPWWQQDPRVRYPSPTELQRRLRARAN